LQGPQFKQAVGAPGGGHRHALREREGQHEATVVVGVLTDQVGAAGGVPEAFRGALVCLVEGGGGGHHRCCWRKAHHSGAMLVRSCSGFQPSCEWMLSEEATSTAGSAARRGPTTSGMGWPVT